MDDEFLDRYRDAPPELLKLARTISDNELKEFRSLQLTIRIVAIGLYALAALIVWWAWSVRDSLHSAIAIAIITYVFAGGVFQYLLERLRARFGRSPDADDPP